MLFLFIYNNYIIFINTNYNTISNLYNIIL